MTCVVLFFINLKGETCQGHFQHKRGDTLIIITWESYIPQIVSAVLDFSNKEHKRKEKKNPIRIKKLKIVSPKGKQGKEFGKCTQFI